MLTATQSHTVRIKGRKFDVYATVLGIMQDQGCGPLEHFGNCFTHRDLQFFPQSVDVEGIHIVQRNGEEVELWQDPSMHKKYPNLIAAIEEKLLDAKWADLEDEFDQSAEMHEWS